MNPFDRLNKRLNRSRLFEPFVFQRTGVIFRGVIDRDYIEINDISGFAPVITCATLDAEEFRKGDLIEHGADLYKFIYAEPDGTGVSRLILETA